MEAMCSSEMSGTFLTTGFYSHENLRSNACREWLIGRGGKLENSKKRYRYVVS
jgi:hypothetical protein